MTHRAPPLLTSRAWGRCSVQRTLHADLPVVVVLTARVQECRSQLGPAVADLVAMPGGADEACVAEREQMTRDASGAELSHRGERSRRNGLVQGGEDPGACAAE